MRIDDNPRMTYAEFMEVSVLYQRKRPIKPDVKPAVTAPTDTKGAKFDARG